MSNKRGASYDEDLGELLSGILDAAYLKVKKEELSSATFTYDNNKLPNLNLRQENILFYVCGYLIHSTVVNDHSS